MDKRIKGILSDYLWRKPEKYKLKGNLTAVLMRLLDSKCLNLKWWSWSNEIFLTLCSCPEKVVRVAWSFAFLSW